MGFSDQEEQLTNSAEDLETGETGSAEQSAALQAEAESSDIEVESSQEALESPGSEESTEIDSTETEPGDTEPEIDTQADAEIETQEPAAPDADDDQPLDIDQPPADEQGTDAPLEEALADETQAEPEIDTQADAEIETQEPAAPDADDDQPLDIDQPPADEQGTDAPLEEALADEAQAEPELAAAPSVAATISETQEEDSVELDLSFLDADQADQAEPEEEGRSWYVVHCYSGYENKVRHNLEQRIETMGMKDSIFDIVVPTEEEIEVKEGKRRTVERRVFPGYILVNMVMTEESWYVVRNTPGVTGFVGMGNTPTPLRPEEVSQIIKRMEADAPRIKVTFKSGERVRIVDGPFNDFRGTVSEIDMERAKVRVMVNFFGRETPVELDFLQVEKT